MTLKNCSEVKFFKNIVFGDTSGCPFFMGKKKRWTEICILLIYGHWLIGQIFSHLEQTILENWWPGNVRDNTSYNKKSELLCSLCRCSYGYWQWRRFCIISITKWLGVLSVTFPPSLSPPILAQWVHEQNDHNGRGGGYVWAQPMVFSSQNLIWLLPLLSP